MLESLNAQAAQSIFESCPTAAVIIDSQSMILGVNQAFVDLVGPLQANGLVGKTISDIANPGLKQLLTDYPKLDWLDSTGQSKSIQVQRTAFDKENTKEVRFFIDRSETAQLESANTVLQEKLQQTLLTDPVTGLLNQRGIALALEPQIARCRRYNTTLTLVMMGIDAPVGRDNLLIEVAQLLKDQLRWADLIGCTDEQEFMLALPETPDTAAIQLSNKLKPLLIDISQERFNGTPIWSCFGIAGWRKNDNAPSLLQRASAALTQARQTDCNEAVAL